MTHSIRSHKLAGATALAAMLLASTAAVHADEGASAMRVFKDPVTGKLRAPTSEEAAELKVKAAPAGFAAKSLVAAPRRGMVTGAINPQIVVHKNGMKSAELDQHTRAYSVATRRADGSIDMDCVTGSENALSAIKSTQSVLTAKKEHGDETQ